jgi:hypothetical protein
MLRETILQEFPPSAAADLVDRSALSEPPSNALPAAPMRLSFWRGASGHHYRHLVYSLTDCPPVGPSTYVLARRDTAGRAEALGIGVVTTRHPVWNLARIRRRAAETGASEIHVHTHAASPSSTRVARDLRARLD